MRRVEISDSQTVELPEQDYDVYYTAVAHMYYDPGRVSGPPEHCYPPEGECDLISFNIDAIQNGAGEMVNDVAVIKACKEKIDYERVDDQLWEAFHDE